MKTSAKSIWIDLDNSPHVPLFVPIIRHYRERGINVVLTAREHSQTIELLKLHGLDGTFTVIGRHHGKGKISKVLGTLGRARQLAAFMDEIDEVWVLDPFLDQPDTSDAYC